MIEIDWIRDYKGEFACPNCGERGLRVCGKTSNKKRVFECPNCSRYTVESYKIKLLDTKFQVNWRRDYKVGEFACPNPDCNAIDVRRDGSQKGKQRFKCKVCQTRTLESIDLTPSILSRFSHQLPSGLPFDFESDRWDLRALVFSFDADHNRFFLHFENLQLGWFKSRVKHYIFHLCKLNNSPKTIDNHLTSLRFFSRYLAEKNIAGIEEINRSMILDFLAWDRTGRDGMRCRLGVLRDFFWTGITQGWFKVDQDIIQDGDYPKKRVSNPDPISDTVRQQIENNLHQLPDPIARMWLISFFAAMRPNELALLRKNCLVQEGSSWKIVWWRKKGKDQHEVPVTRTIAKVIQSQQEYIEQLWGDDWDYLFCHYQGLSKTNPSQPNLQPVKKVITASSRNPLTLAIRCLILLSDIRDNNGSRAKFSSCLVRPTRLTQLFEQGHDLAVVSAWAGHKQLATTALHYTHVSCDLIEKEAGHIQRALFNADGQYLRYESLPKSFWENQSAHQLNLPGDHINTPIYGYCGLPLDQDCDKFRACYTCRQHFVAVPEKLPLYIKTRDELRAKSARAMEAGADVLVEQYQLQADQLDRIIASLERAA